MAQKRDALVLPGVSKIVDVSSMLRDNRSIPAKARITTSPRMLPMGHPLQLLGDHVLLRFFGGFG